MGRRRACGSVLIYLTKTIGKWKVRPITWGHYELLRALDHSYFSLGLSESDTKDHAEALTLCRIELEDAIKLAESSIINFDAEVSRTAKRMKEPDWIDWKTLWMEQTAIPLTQGGIPGGGRMDVAVFHAAKSILGTSNLLQEPARKVFDAAYFAWKTSGQIKQVDADGLSRAIELKERLQDGKQGQS